MKLKDFLQETFEKAGLKEEGEAIWSASDWKDVDLKEDVVEKFNNTFMTKERAMNDPDILKNIRKDARKHFLTEVDSKLENFYEVLPEEQKITLQETDDTHKKLDLLSDYVKNIKSHKGHDSDSKEKISQLEEQLRKTEKKLREENKNIKSQYEEQISSLNNKFKDEKINTKIRNTIFSSFKLAENIPGGRDYMADGIINDVRKEYVPVLESDQVKLRQEVDGTLKDAYDGNDPVNLKKVLEKKLEPFLAKAPTQQKAQDNGVPPIVQQEPKTLREANHQKALNNINATYEEFKKSK